MKIKIIALVLTVFMITCFNSSLAALPVPDSDTLIVKKCNDFTPDGRGGSKEWSKADWTVIQADKNVEKQYLTKVKILYSGKGIYFLFDCGDRKIVSTMSKDYLNLWEEDVAEVFLWPDVTFPVYFEYEISPRNFELPIIVPNRQGKFLGWLPWNYSGNRKVVHAVYITADQANKGSVIKWQAEFFIPFDLLAPLLDNPPKPGNTWRANLYRIDYDNGITAFGWKKTESTFHEYNKFGTLRFE
jgi:hypothetical protein